MSVTAFAGHEHKVVSTEELIDLLAQGYEVLLPPVLRPSDEILSHYPEEDVARLDVRAEDNPIVSVEYVDEEEVQCIAVEDERHMYLTDDMIPTHNTSNIVFLKSTDDSMLDTLEKMSGKKHESHTDSKMISRDEDKVLMRNQGVISYTMTTTEAPVISYNDMAFIPERNSIVFRAGDSPIWNRNETVLPMSWRLLKSNAIRQPGKNYSLQTIPTLSSAIDFDVRKNQPDFQKMLQKRKDQAMAASDAVETFQKVFGYSEYDISQLDPDVYADSIMEVINAELHKKAGISTAQDIVDHKTEGDDLAEAAEDNPDQRREAEKVEHDASERQRKRYAGGMLSRADLIGDSGVTINHQFDKDFIDIWKKKRHQLVGADRGQYLAERGNDLYSSDGRSPYITMVSDASERAVAEKAARDPEMRTYSENRNLDDFSSYVVHDEFYIFLARFEMWDFSGGLFEQEMRARLMV